VLRVDAHARVEGHISRVAPDYKTLQDLRPDTSRRPQEGLAAYLKEVELAAGMQTEQATAPSRDASTPSS